MKKVILASIALVLAMGLAIANTTPTRETIKVPVEQVPVSVRIAFEKDFGTIPEGGYWTAQVEKESNGTRTIVTPLWYSFNKKAKGTKIEARYSPQGSLESYAGLEKTSPIANATVLN